MREHARTGGEASDDPARINLDPDIVMAALFAMLLLLGGLVGLTLYQQGQISEQQDALINDSQVLIGRNQQRLGPPAADAALPRASRSDQLLPDGLPLLHAHQRRPRNGARLLVRRAAQALERQVRPARASRIHSYRSRLEDRGGLPILDCEPNVRGGPARYISPREQRRFVRRWRSYQLEPVCV
jgi:hypothetical protein